MSNENYMRAAIALAEKGAGFVNPNPLVGAVISRNGEITGRGAHEQYGEAHAEVNALADCTDSAAGATMHVTLEPCCHHGKTPPCTETIIKSGISRVVIGCLDPNPKVAGKGAQRLREAGIEVVTGILESECRKQNEVFFHYIQTKTPFVVMKYAMTLDGETVAPSHGARWITGEKAREQVHRDRSRYSGIMAGIGTVTADDPMLDCRLPEIRCRQPVRIICDTHLRIPHGSQIVRTAGSIRTIIATCHESKGVPGCEIVRLPEKNGQVDLRELMQVLGGMGIDSILLEGGRTLHRSAMKSGIVNKVQAYIAPKLFGGAVAAVADSKITHYGDDILIEGVCLPEL
jgi:diaminohydroxyphosphoribosylaminopyrimidine deaminase/5-amino-6-(5-phosphoribosylamino)uracil reductase